MIVIETAALVSGLLPIAAGAGLVNTIADATSVGLEYQKASFTNSSFSDANSKALLFTTGIVSGFFGKKIIKNSFNHFEQSTRSDKAIPLLQEINKNQIIEFGKKSVTSSSIILVNDNNKKK